MTRDELEFSISQYLDGTLPERERDALETRLGSDVEARAIFAEYESIERVLGAAPLPEVRWDRFAREISAAVAREEMPAQSFVMSRWLRPARLALAASVLIVGGIGFALLRAGGGFTTSESAEPTRIVRTDPPAEAPVADTPTPTEPIRIAIGPSDAVRDEPTVVYYADTLVQRPSRALIVSAARSGEDNTVTPF